MAGIMFDDTRTSGIMFNDGTLMESTDNPLVASDFMYIGEDANDVWMRQVDEVIDVCYGKFQQTVQYKQATRGMSAKERRQYDKEMKFKVKAKVLAKREKIEKLYIGTYLVGLVIFVVGCIATCAGLVAASAAIWLIQLIALCVYDLCDGYKVKPNEVKEALDELF